VPVYDIFVWMGFAHTILCIDDDQDDLMFIREAINSHHKPFEMIEATDGKAAMDFLWLSKEKGALPCLIIMDVNMPKLNGKKTVPLIKADQTLSSIPMVIFTTSSNNADRLYFQQFDVHYFTKPNHYGEFVKKVKEMLSQYPQI
jgi:CheY-like chemotaxis protein